MKILLRWRAKQPVDGASRFDVSEVLDAKGSRDGRVRISYLGDNFRKFFLGKIEANVDACAINAHVLKETLTDAPIVDELADHAETAVAHLWQLLTKQPNGESGILLTDWRRNVFYIADTHGKLRTVLVHWVGDDWGRGWALEAEPIEEGYRREPEFQILTR